MDELILKEREVKEKIIGIVNESGLPAFILKPIIKDIYDQLNSIEEQQYKQALISQKSKEINEENKKKKEEKKEGK